VAGEDGLQVWRVVANIINKQSRRADKEWSYRLGVGHRAKTIHRKNNFVMKSYQGPATVLGWKPTTLDSGHENVIRCLLFLEYERSTASCTAHAAYSQSCCATNVFSGSEGI
jgi:hypothetical protein